MGLSRVGSNPAVDVFLVVAMGLFDFFELIDSYTDLKPIGSGAYGFVW
jgi:hypothetical protein